MAIIHAISTKGLEVLTELSTGWKSFEGVERRLTVSAEADLQKLVYLPNSKEHIQLCIGGVVTLVADEHFLSFFVEDIIPAIEPDSISDNHEPDN